jgi:hypothetical protein
MYEITHNKHCFQYCLYGRGQCGQSGDILDTDVETRKKPDTECAYNVTLRRVRVNIVAVEKQEVLHILSLCL